MKVLGVALALFAFLAGAPGRAAEAEKQPVTIIHAGHLLAIPGAPMRANVSLVIRAGRITALVDGFVNRPPGDAQDVPVRIVDLAQRYVLPGLIDGHVHLTLAIGQSPPLVKASEAARTIIAVAHARQALWVGFTTVRDVGAAGLEVFALRDAIAAGLVPGPRILAAGEIVSTTGGHGDVSGYRRDVLQVLQPMAICDSPYACRKVVRLLVKYGADLIKLSATGGGAERHGGPDDPPEMFNDELRAVVETAHSFGLKVAAHAHGTAGIKAALRAGVDSIEHGTFLDDEAIALFLRTGAWLVPTLSVRDRLAENFFKTSGAIRAREERMLRETVPTMKRAYKAGVKFALGSDAGVVPHGQGARELEWLVKVGLSPAEALVVATLNTADMMGLGGDIGSLEVGKSADVIAVADNPLADISALRKITFVMRAGVIYRRK